MYLNQLGVYGWNEADENLLLASLLTGDPLLLIGSHGAAKTHVAHKMAEALGRSFIAYDASKAMFEDILGYPNVEKLKQGIIEYVPSPVTIWDKEIVLIDELNRAVPELQSKWLEIIRSRNVMGFETQVKWVWSAMNPVSYSATNALDEALISRYAIFLYPPAILEMTERDRIKVAEHINGDDAPSLSEWTDGVRAKTVASDNTEATGRAIEQCMRRAGGHFLRLKQEMGSLSEFLAKFADLLLRESHGQITLDGRRLGFIYRNLLANRAIELAKAEGGYEEVPDFVESARHVMFSSIPVGLNEEELNREQANHQIEICFDLLSTYFEEGAELTRVNLVYELFTTPDLMRKAELLLTHDLGEFALSKAWTDLLDEDRNLTLLAYVALQIDARRPGTVPQELLASLSDKIEPADLSTRSISVLTGASVEYVEEVEELLDRDDDLRKIIAYEHIRRLTKEGEVTPARIERTADAIEADIQRFESLLHADLQEGGQVA